MFRYTLKRIAYSLLIVGGVLILTFLLFRLAAGDPAATVLGKNPSPREIEEMREELGSDKPLFFGLWKQTELYSSVRFRDGRTVFPNIAILGNFTVTSDGLKVRKGTVIRFLRNFDTEKKEKIRMTITTAIPLEINRIVYIPRKHRIRLEFSNPPPELSIVAFHSGQVEEFYFERPTKGWLDSQSTAAFCEIVCLIDTFPYVSFFNFGKTLQTREPIRAKLWKGMFPSLLLMVPIFLGELVLGIVLAMIACVFRGQMADKLILCLSVAGMSISYLALIIFGQWFFGYYLNLFPVWGWGDIRYLILPVAIGIVSGTGGGVRFYRTVFLDEMNREYLRTAVAKGVSPAGVYFKHLLKNALIPVITRASTVLPFLFTGSLLLETFFGIPGLGYEGVNALNDADLPMLKALVILSALLFVGINLLTDLAYAWADPRVRPDAQA